MVSKISIAPTMAGYPNENSLVQPVTVVPTAGETFQINNTKLYAPVVICRQMITSNLQKI